MSTSSIDALYQALPLNNTVTPPTDIFRTTWIYIPAIDSVPKSPAPAPPRSPNPSTPVQTSPASIRNFYCQTCRKSFATLQTWNSHEASEKHIESLKNSEVSKRESPQKRRSELRTPTKKHNQPVDRPTPIVADALLKRKQADSIALMKPSIAASVYWNIAKALWQEGRVRDTATTLSRLILLLESLQRGGSPSPSPSTSASLTPSQISTTKHFAQVAQARILASIPGWEDQSRSIFVDLTSETWNLRKICDETIVELIRFSPVSLLLSRTLPAFSLNVNQTHSKLPLPTASKIESIRLCYIALEYAAICLLSPNIESNALSQFPCKGWQECLLGCCLAVAGALKTRCRADYEIALEFMSRIYRAYAEPHLVADCLQLLSTSIFVLDFDENSNDTGKVSWDRRFAWILEAAVIALESDDFIRFEGIRYDANRLKQTWMERIHSSNLDSQQGHILDPKADIGLVDLECLFEIYQAVSTRDEEHLYNLRTVELPRLRSRCLFRSHNSLIGRIVDLEIAEEAGEASDVITFDKRKGRRKERVERWWRRVGSLIK